MPTHTPSERLKRKNERVSRKMSLLRREGKGQKQAVAQATNTVKRKK